MDVRRGHMAAEPTKQPESVILHLMPAKVLRELAEHARRIQREEAVRRYILAHIWFVLLIALVIFALASVAGGLVTIATILVTAFLGIDDYLAMFVLLGPGFIVFMAVTVLLLNNLFAWAEDRATASNP